MQATSVQFLGQEDPLEKGQVTHSSILAWRIPMDRGAWRATVHGITELVMTERLSTAQRSPRKWVEEITGKQMLLKNQNESYPLYNSTEAFTVE